MDKAETTENMDKQKGPTPLSLGRSHSLAQQLARFSLKCIFPFIRKVARDTRFAVNAFDGQNFAAMPDIQMPGAADSGSLGFQPGTL